MTAVIFLDMDDVLCTLTAHRAKTEDEVPPCSPWPFIFSLSREGIKLLNEVIDGRDILFVSSSTWRTHVSRDELLAHLRRYGFAGSFHEDWRTPSNRGYRYRGEEIKAWLAEHPEIESYAIIDDSVDAGLGHFDNFVQVIDYENGFSEYDAAALREILSR